MVTSIRQAVSLLGFSTVRNLTMHPVAPGGPPLTLAHILHAADLYVNDYGLEILPTKRAGAYPADRAFEEIGMRQKMPEVLGKFKKEYESSRGLF